MQRDGLQPRCRSCIAASMDAARRRARAFVAEVNTRTVCAHCGAQPIEWHNPEHVELGRQFYRISHLVSTGKTPKTIQKEMDRCTPLCRRCHMREDGRLRTFVAAGEAARARSVKSPSPCDNCTRPYKPLRKGLCNACYLHRRKTPRRLTPGYTLGKHSPYKLTGTRVAEIRHFYRRGYATKWELSRIYGVSYSTIHRVIVGDRWPERQQELAS